MFWAQWFLERVRYPTEAWKRIHLRDRLAKRLPLEHPWNMVSQVDAPTMPEENRMSTQVFISKSDLAQKLSMRNTLPFAPFSILVTRRNLLGYGQEQSKPHETQSPGHIMMTASWYLHQDVCSFRATSVYGIESLIKIIVSPC